METALLVAAVLIAGLCCPAMMWWNRRQGRDACCVPSRSGEEMPSTDELRRRHDELSAAIAERELDDSDLAAPRSPTAQSRRP